MNATHTALLTVAGLSVTLAVSSPAPAQDSLGSGTALDANLSPGSGGFNRPAPQEDFRARNLLITNNVIGGRGFRDSVGYTADFDFRGVLGSDALYSFRADSAWSDVNFLNYGNTYQRLRFGQDMGLIEYRRDSYGSSSQTLGEGVQYKPGAMIDAQLQLDQISFFSSTTATSRMAAEPVGIGYTQDEEGTPYLISASSLTGLDVTPLQEQHQLIGLSTYDMARLREDLVAQRDMRQVGAPFAAKYEDLLTSDLRQDQEPDTGRLEPQAVQNRIDLMAEPEFKRILERVAGRYAEQKQAEPEEEEPDLYKELDEDLQRVREYLAGREGEQEEGAEGSLYRPDLTPPQPQDPLNPLEPGPSERTQPGRPGVSDFEVPPPAPLPTAPGEADEPPVIKVPLQVEQFAKVLRHGERVKELTSGDQTRFDELLAGAEQNLRSGEYFWAERRFNRALRFTPGHPLATAGLAHAQIGAGLYLSASLTLQSLFRFQPEMIDVRYEEGLMPNRLRLLKAVDTLKGRLNETRDRLANGFLLAYIGHLLEDRALIEQGLAVMGDAEPGNLLLPLLKEIWLAEDEEGEADGKAMPADGEAAPAGPEK